MKKNKKLSLSRLTIRALGRDLARVNGGVLPPTTTQASNVDNVCRSQAYRSSLTSTELVYPETSICISELTVC
jgi:hypothetical protein